jgi:hypothetical protein
MVDTQDDAGSGGIKDLLAIGAAVTALVTTVSALAVTGALQEMQRDQAGYLILAAALVLLAAVLWAVAALYKPPAISAKVVHEVEKLARENDPDKIAAERAELAEAWGKTSIYKRLRIATLAPATAYVLFAGGIAAGLWGMVRTQGERERPQIAAAYNVKERVFSGTASTHNLGTEQRLMTQVTALKRTAEPGKYEVEKKFVALSGPDSSGNVVQAFRYKLPSDGYAAVVVAATTGDRTDCLNDVGSGAVIAEPTPQRLDKTAQSKQPGCAVFYLP